MSKRQDVISIGYNCLPLPFYEDCDEYRWTVVPSNNLSYKSLDKLADCQICEMVIKFKRNDFDGYYKLKVVNCELDDDDDDLEECSL